MIEAYLLDLEGMGDYEKKLVTKEIFEWVNSNDPGRPTKGKTSMWKDLLAPDDALDYAKENDGKYYQGGIMLTSGTWSNDRALSAPPMLLSNHERAPIFSSTKELMAYCKKNDIQIVDEYQGGIY
jgi:hypothetical protein